MSGKKGISRRRFLGTGLTATSTVLLASQASRAQPAGSRPAGDDIRAGIIGVGGRGSGLLAAMNQSPGVRVTAICDIDEGHLNRAAAAVEADRPELFRDYRRLLDFRELDAVVVATPCHLHKEMAVAVLDSGRHCYCEKPMAITAPDVNAVYKAAKRAKGIFQIGTQLRYGAPWKTSIEAIQNGIIGKVVFVRGHRHNIGDLPHDRQWLFERDKCGDTIVEQAVHEFDIYNQIFQDIPRRIAGFGSQALRFDPPGRDILDNYVLAVDYGNKRTLDYSHSWIAVDHVPCDGRRELVYGEKGQLDVEEGKIYFKGADKPERVDMEPSGDTTQLAIDDFFRCIREHDRPMCDEESGRSATLFALLGRKALYEGRVVAMTELFAEM